MPIPIQGGTEMYIKGKHSVPVGNPKLWRYMSYSKFQSLIETSSLYFCRLDKFEDQLECTQPDGSLKFAIATENPWQMHERQYMDAVLYMLRNLTYVNCWHINDNENSFMWENYAMCHGNEGVAIQTDLNAVKAAVEKVERKISDMRISYVNFKTHYVEYFMQNPFEFIALKDVKYEPENELRLVTVENEYPDIDVDDFYSVYSKQYSNHSGELIAVDLNQLIKRIYLAPNSTDRFAQLVKDLIKSKDLDIEIIKSSV